MSRVARPQIVTDDRASGAKYIDGSLTIDTNRNHWLSRKHNDVYTSRRWTFSCWCKKVKIGGYHQLFTGFESGTNQSGIIFMNDDSIKVYSQGGLSFTVQTHARYRDVNGWYHICVAVDTHGLNNDDRVKLWVNGKRNTYLVTASYPDRADETYINTNVKHYIGSNQPSSNTFDGQICEVHFVDGIAVNASEFGFQDPLTDTWRPKKYEGLHNHVDSAGQVDYVSGFDVNTYTSVGVQDNGSIWDCFTGHEAGGGFDLYQNVTSTYTAPGSGIPYSSTIRLYCKHGSGGKNNITIDGNSFNPSTGSGNNTGAWNDISSVVTGGVLNTIVASRGGGGRNTYWSAIEVDGTVLSQFPPGSNGFYLPLDGNTLIGRDQSGGSDGYGVNWSEEGKWVFSSGTNSGNEPPKAFDGSLSTFAANVYTNDSNGNYLEYTFPRDVTVGSKLELNLWMADTNETDMVQYYTINSESEVTMTHPSPSMPGNHWVTLKNSSNADWTGTLTKLKLRITRTSGNQTNNNLYAIRVDGKILQDPNNWSVHVDSAHNNVANGHRPSVTIDKATGGLPILNTVNGGNIASSGTRLDYSPHTPQWLRDSGAIKFDGDTDYLTVPHSSDYNLGNGNFTLEFWLHPTEPFSHNDNGFVSIGENAGTKRILQISGHIGTTNGINLAASSNGSAWDMFNMANIGTATMYKWQHLAVVRNGTALTTYKDGVQIHTTNIGSTSFFSNGDYTIQIGNYLNSGSAFSNAYEGLISNVRLVVGTAVYTSAFTPPTEPLTAITNTKLLCCQSNSSATAATTIATGSISVVGDVAAVASEAAGSIVLAVPLANTYEDYSGRVNPSKSDKTMNANGSIAREEGIDTSTNFYGIGYYFDGSNDNFYTSNHADFNFGNKDWTMEAWVDASTGGSDMAVLNQSNGGASSNSSWIMYSTSGCPSIYTTENTGWDNNVSSTPDVGNTGWHHWAAVRHGDDLNMYVDGVKTGQTKSMFGVSIPNSTRTVYIGCQEPNNYSFQGHIQDVRIYNGLAKYTKDFLVPSQRPGISAESPSGIANDQGHQKSKYGSVNLATRGAHYLSIADHADLDFGNSAWSIECWIYPVSAGSNSYGYIWSKGHDMQIAWMSNTYGISMYSSTDGSSYNIISNGDITGGAQAFPANKWTHFHISRSGNNVYVHADGKHIATVGFSGTIYDNGTAGAIGVYGPNAATYSLHGNISNFRIVKGSALHTTDSFTPPTKPLTVVTNTKLLCCQSPTDVTASAITPSTISKSGNPSASTNNPFEDDLDRVMGQASTIYPIMNPRDNYDDITFTRGNLRVTTTAGDRHLAASMMLPRHGKYYWEMYAETINSAGYLATGVYHETGSKGSSAIATAQGRWMTASGNKGGQGGSSSGYGHGFDDGDWIGVAVNMDTGKIWESINGVWQESGDPVNDAHPMYDDLRTAYSNIDWYPVFANWQSGNTAVFNFGQTPFRYTPPEGFVSLNSSTIIPESTPVITRPKDYYMTAYYTGNGDASGGKQISTSFKPDLIWNKNTTTAYHNRVWDSVRGWNKAIYSNNKELENNWTDYGYPIDVTDTYVKVAQGTNSGNLVNVNGSLYAQWMWKAGGGSGSGGEFWKDDIKYSSAAAVGLSGADITPTAASIGTKQGFSIIKYTGNGTSGSTVPHGLSQAPTFILTKALTQSGSPTVGWGVFHVGGSYSGSMLYLMQGTSTANDTNVFTTTTQTNNHFTIGDWGGINESGKNYIAYVWHDVPGFQKFGTYKGNNLNNGPYVDLGFTPGMVTWKATNGNNWGTLDNARDICNPLKHRLHWNSYSTTNSGAGNVIEFMANGFKCINSDTLENASATMLYMAWANSPISNPYGGSSVGQ